MTNFPPLRMAVLTALQDIKANLDALDDSGYDEETKKVLRDLLAPKTVEVTVEKEVIVEGKRGRGRPSKDVELSTEDKELLTSELKNLVKQLNDMGTGEGEKLETSERVQITRIKANILNQLLQMRERNTTAQRMEEFKEVVIGILNDLIEEKDRDEFLRRLEPWR